MDETHSIEDKLKVILNGFLHKNYQTTNDIYFEMLITHLSGKGGKDYSNLLHTTYVHDWIDKCLILLLEDYSQLNDKVTTLMLRLVVLLTQNEWLVVQVRDRQFADRIQILINNNINKLTASVKLGYVRLIAAISKNGLGLGWVKRHQAWNLLISFCTENNNTVYVIREAMAVIYELLYKFSVKTNNEELCIEMLAQILNPILENVFNENSPDVRVNDIELQSKIIPRLELIGYILEKTLDSECKTKIVHYCESNFRLDRNLWKLADMTHNNHELSKILKVMTSINYAKLIYEKWRINEQILSEDFNQFGVNFWNHMNFAVLRRGCSNVLEIAEYNFTLWKKLGQRVPTQILIENNNIEFENQLILFHLLPVLFILRPTNSEQDEIFETYIMKLFAISCEYTVRIVYAYRAVLLDCPQNTCELALKSINGILAMEHILNKNRAILVFQAMMYAVKEFTVESQESQVSSCQPAYLLLQSPNVLRSILICLHTLIQSYRITWKDSIETICLLNVVLDLLKDHNLLSRVAVQSLKLAQLSIEHYLSPNLALLMDNFSESGMQDLGPVMMKRLHDNSWEVRDSTLELITSIVEISNIKFPGFQQHIIDSGICPVVFDMAKNDDEPYIRASAFKCLTQMTLINLIWEKALCDFNMLNYLLTSINEETEGIVRMEAVQLITKIYDNHKIQPNNMENVYVIMSNCAMNDLHWEVKINALHFWNCVILHQFENQGMIDGIFPTVTFSKEYKKIVTLTDKEILLRITKILQDLSELGCLNVLMECLHDECDLEVVKITVIIVRKLFENLNRYNYIKNIEKDTANNMNNPAEKCNVDMSTMSTTEEESSTVNSDNMEVNGETGEKMDSDKIIESIVVVNDLNLLAKNYENNQMMMSGQQSKSANDDGGKNMMVDEPNEYESECEVQHRKLIDKISANEFVRLINKMNLDSLIEMKKDWITSTESFDSLLDDMIYSIKELNVNDADCY